MLSIGYYLLFTGTSIDFNKHDLNAINTMELTKPLLFQYFSFKFPKLS